MSWFVSDERVPIEGLACRCPGEPHPDGDTVWLRVELTPDAGLAFLRLMREADAEGGTPDDVQERIGRLYARFGIVDWTFLDEEGNPVPASPEYIERLSWDVVYPIADKGDDLYAGALLRPLVASRSKSSPNGRTARSTSARRSSSRGRQKR